MNLLKEINPIKGAVKRVNVLDSRLEFFLKNKNLPISIKDYAYILLFISVLAVWIVDAPCYLIFASLAFLPSAVGFLFLSKRFKNFFKILTSSILVSVVAVILGFFLKEAYLAESLVAWDFFIIIFFTTILIYSFILGRSSILKMIIATYVAALTADGFGNILDRFVLSDARLIETPASLGSESLVIFKILIFVLVILLVTVRGSFFVAMDREKSFIINLATTGAFGFLSAGLIISTILVYISGGVFVGNATSAVGVDITTDSLLAKMMTENYNIWFSLPAIAFLVISFVGGEKDEVEIVES